jgi:hypothetical protein
MSRTSVFVSCHIVFSFFPLSSCLSDAQTKLNFFVFFYLALTVFRLFGSSGACSACGQGIPANELVMRVGGAGPTGPAAGAQTPANAAGAVYHVKCFACTKCQTQLMPGDRYALIGGSLLCEQDCHKMMKNNNNNNNVNTNNNNHANQAGGVGASSVLPPGGAAAVGNATGGGGGGPLKKGKVGRPRRSRD